jgi:hypothetical protein
LRISHQPSRFDSTALQFRRFALEQCLSGNVFPNVQAMGLEGLRDIQASAATDRLVKFPCPAARASPGAVAVIDIGLHG